MNTNIEDDMLKKFFSENKREFADNGFTQKVMEKLPKRQNKNWILWAFTIVGLVLSMYLVITTGLINSLPKLLNDIPLFYLLVIVFSFPFVVFIGMIFQKNSQIRFI